MKRLFAAFSRPQVQPITPWLLAFVRKDFAEDFGCPNQLHRSVEDLTVRDWGDDQFVNHGDQACWSVLVEECASFRAKFMKATLQPLENRQEREMRIEDYLIEKGV